MLGKVITLDKVVEENPSLSGITKAILTGRIEELKTTRDELLVKAGRIEAEIKQSQDLLNKINFKKEKKQALAICKKDLREIK